MNEEARSFDFTTFIKNLIEAVARTVETRNVGNSTRFDFPGTPFPVFVSKCESWGVTFLAQIVPTDRERVKEFLVEEMKRALRSKAKKLQAAKARREQTILLLDSDDYALINYEILAEAFGKAVRPDEALCEGIDDIYIQQRGGVVWIFPVKLKDRIYPDLNEWDEYWKRQAELLGVRGD